MIKFYRNSSNDVYWKIDTQNKITRVQSQYNSDRKQFNIIQYSFIQSGAEYIANENEETSAEAYAVHCDNFDFELKKLTL